MPKRGRPRLFTDATIRRIKRRVLEEGVPPKDIAEVLGCTPWTVRSIARGYGTYKEKTA